MKEKKLIEEIEADIVHYSARNLYFFIYDKEKLIANPQVFKSNYQSCGCLKAENQQNITERLHRIDGTCVEILEKRKHRSDNTSGFRGVHQLKNGRYRVDIGFKRKRFYIGSFDDYDEAVRIRLNAEHLLHDGFVEAYYNRKI